jgi:hypothetical protein
MDKENKAYAHWSINQPLRTMKSIKPDGIYLSYTSRWHTPHPRSGRSQFKDNLGIKLARYHLTQQAEVLVHFCNPSYKGGTGVGRKMVVQGQPRKKGEALSKNN